MLKTWRNNFEWKGVGGGGVVSGGWRSFLEIIPGGGDHSWGAAVSEELLTLHALLLPTVSFLIQ